MDSKKLAQLIKLVVEQEIKKQLPKMIKEEVSKVLNETRNLGSKKAILEEVDPFELANLMLDKDRTQPTKSVASSFTPKKQLSKNAALNEILNQTKPFTSTQRVGGQGIGASVLDNYQSDQSLNEDYSNLHIPNYMDAEEDIDTTLSFNNSGAALGMDGLRNQLSSNLEYGNPSSGPRKQGLGVSTGLPGLDRILNRDNSELVKRFKK